MCPALSLSAMLALIHVSRAVVTLPLREGIYEDIHVYASCGVSVIRVFRSIIR